MTRFTNLPVEFDDLGNSNHSMLAGGFVALLDYCMGPNQMPNERDRVFVLDSMRGIVGRARKAWVEEEARREELLKEIRT